MAHSHEHVIWLGLTAFFVVMLFVVLGHWRKYKETREKMLREQSLRARPAPDTEKERERARAIFKGDELKTALDFLDEAEKLQARVQRHRDHSESTIREVTFFMVFVIVLGIAYGMHKLVNVS